jgi:hypothetical protein
MDEAVDLLGGRIDKARELAAKLEALTAKAQSSAPERAAASQPAAPERHSPLDRAGVRPAQRAPAPRAEPEPLTLTRQDAIQAHRPAASPSPHARTAVDDELFGPVLRRSAGVRP